jgi:peptidoglycan/xylan/chitin deacetylase (PgdA/CDA1 family)
VVLCYHDVGTDPANTTNYYVSPAQLREQLEAIASWGMTFVALDEIVDRLVRGASLDGLVAVTFDDGLVGVRDHALDILRDLSIPPTVFVVSAVQGVGPPFWPGAQRTLRADELRALSASGVRLGSHTLTHPSLPELDDRALRDQLVRSREDIEAITGGPCDLLAYPFGHQDPRVREAARSAGFTAASTFTFGRVEPTTDRYLIPRFCMGPQHHRARLAYQLSRPAWAW